jgi:hypothetical protein
MLFREVFSVQKIIQIKNTLHGQNADVFNVIVGDIFSNLYA